MMFSTMVIAFQVLFLVVFTHALRCNLPSINDRVVSSPGEGSEALLKQNCPDLKDRTTVSWKNGGQVKSKCLDVTPGTAIATFEGDGGEAYNGGDFKHAAIFVGRCNSRGFYVFDQSSEGGVNYRQLKYSGIGEDGGANYYVIN